MDLQIVVNGDPRQVEQGATVADLLQQLALDVKQVAVELNLDLVPREQHSRQILKAGDSLEVVTLVGGG